MSFYGKTQEKVHNNMKRVLSTCKKGRQRAKIFKLNQYSCLGLVKKTYYIKSAKIYLKKGIVSNTVNFLMANVVWTNTHKSSQYLLKV